MQKTKIEWTDYSWNPVIGCKHGCPFCYARVISFDIYGHFNPTFFENRLNEPLKIQKPSKIFVVSMGDLFGDWVSNEWIDKVFNTCIKAERHTFIFLTKNPKRYLEFKTFPNNFWIGTSILKQSDLDNTLEIFKNINAKVKFLSLEPLLTNLRLKESVDWVIIGACSDPMPKQPEKEWVIDLIEDCKKFNIPIFMKDNLIWNDKLIEFPKIISQNSLF